MQSKGLYFGKNLLGIRLREHIRSPFVSKTLFCISSSCWLLVEKWISKPEISHWYQVAWFICLQLCFVHFRAILRHHDQFYTKEIETGNLSSMETDTHTQGYFVIIEIWDNSKNQIKNFGWKRHAPSWRNALAVRRLQIPVGGMFISTILSTINTI